MSIRKRNWTAPDGTAKQAWLVDYIDQAGKRRAKQFARKKDADAYADHAKQEVRQGVHTHDRDSVTVAIAADLWLARAEAEKLERSTLKRYEELSPLYVVPKFGAVKLSALSKVQVQNWRLKLLQSVSRSMAGKILSALSAMLNNAMETGAIAQNVAAGVKVAKAARVKERITPPARTDLKAMIDAATDKERPFILTGIFTGLRSSELRGLRWADIDLSAATVTVRQRADAWGKIGPPKSEAGRRTIPIPQELVSELRRWKLACPPSSLDLAFPSTAGTPLRRNNMLRRMFFPLQVRAGLGTAEKGKYGFHDLRHAAASGWIANRIDLQRLQFWMGHEDIKLTLDTYGHLLADQERDAELALQASRDLFG